MSDAPNTSLLTSTAVTASPPTSPVPDTHPESRSSSVSDPTTAASSSASTVSPASSQPPSQTTASQSPSGISSATSLPPSTSSVLVLTSQLPPSDSSTSVSRLSQVSPTVQSSSASLSQPSSIESTSPTSTSSQSRPPGSSEANPVTVRASSAEFFSSVSQSVRPSEISGSGVYSLIGTEYTLIFPSTASATLAATDTLSDRQSSDSISFGVVVGIIVGCIAVLAAVAMIFKRCVFPSSKGFKQRRLDSLDRHVGHDIDLEEDAELAGWIGAGDSHPGTLVNRLSVRRNSVSDSISGSLAKLHYISNFNNHPDHANDMLLAPIIGQSSLDRSNTASRI
ncbi:hypothetical protein BJ741DRAFT_690629 [Chytriomyces cf. hyalinus JEL632]|nr:hypothetical protein BJ741DRAFT_690629 [Chytriomyces cf. hyalinus JEL632]